MLQPLPNFEDAIATARSTAEFYTKRKPVSATINTLANALYKVRWQMPYVAAQHSCDRKREATLHAWPLHSSVVA
jgi:hypothetical protein